MKIKDDLKLIVNNLQPRSSEFGYVVGEDKFRELVSHGITYQDILRYFKEYGDMFEYFGLQVAGENLFIKGTNYVCVVDFENLENFTSLFEAFQFVSLGEPENFQTGQAKRVL